MKKIPSSIAVMLVFLALIGSAYAEGVTMYGGANGNVGGAAKAWGGAVNVVNPIYSGSNLVAMYITQGLESHVKIAAGQTGNAFSKWANLAGAKSQTPILNGEKYRLYADYSGTTNAGARKITPQKEVRADAELESYVFVDNSNINEYEKRNYLYGESEISSEVYDAANAEAYAFATGRTSFDAKQITCTTCPPVKEVYGSAVGTTDIEANNKECLDCASCTPVAPTGIVLGNGDNGGAEAEIESESAADDYSSYTDSEVSTTMEARRPTAVGTTWVNGYAQGTSTANARDGNADPNNLPAWTAATYINGRAGGSASAYGIGDIAREESYATAYAEHNIFYDIADNVAYVNAWTKRVNAFQPVNFPVLPVKATSDLSINFNAKAQDTDTYNTFAQESATVILNAASQLKNINNAATYSNAKLQLTGVRDVMATPVVKATIRDTVNNYGPLTGDAADSTSISERASGMTAQASDNPGKNVILTDSGKTVTDFIDGTSVQGGTSFVNIAPAVAAGQPSVVHNPGNPLPTTQLTATNNVFKLDWNDRARA